MGRDRSIRDVVDEEPAGRALRSVLAKMEGALAGVDIPGWETPEAASAWVRSSRRAAQRTPGVGQVEPIGRTGAMAAEAPQRRRAHVVLPERLIGEVDERVGQRGRSRFIEAAVEEKLKRLRRSEALERALGSSSEETGGVPAWDTSESTAEWVRGLRREWDGRDESDAAAMP